MAMTIEGVEKRGSTYFLQVHEITVDPVNNGREYKPTKDDLAELKADIRENGQQVPVKIRSVKTAEGMRAVLVFGFRRVEAIRQINEEDGTNISVECVGESRVNEEDAYRMNVAENENRKDFTPIDYGRQCLRWRKHFGKTTAEIAAIYRKPERWVTDKEKLMSLPSDVRRDVAAGLMTERAGLELGALPEETQTKVRENLAQRREEAKEAAKQEAAEAKPSDNGKPALSPKTAANRKGKIDRKAVADAARAAGLKRARTYRDLKYVLDQAAEQGSQMAKDIKRYMDDNLTEETLLKKLLA